MEILLRVLAFGVLGISTVSDIRKREISPLVCIVAGMAGLIVRLISGDRLFPELLLAALPAAFFAVISAATHGKVGMGDALILLSLAVLLSPFDIMSVLVTGLCAISIVSIGLLITKKAEFGSELPMVPFMLLGLGVCTFMG
ncbi:MAG: hypothetical protein E7241_03805 [Lachnospiraceae bacterium]|nr:hypothetical protein [Lachnospiraceae bacterium]